MNRVLAKEGVVDLYLDRRLPLQPKDSYWHSREQLRAALRNMRVPEGKILQATYVSSDEGFCDIENVLIYNVGSGAFAAAVCNGIRFVRRRDETRREATAKSPIHHHNYAFAEAPTTPTLAMAKFEFAMPQANSSLKPHMVWWCATKASAASALQAVSGRFGLHVELTCSDPAVSAQVTLLI